MEELTKKSKVIGIMYAGDNIFYAVDGPKKLCNDEGTPVDGWGWFCVDATPINLEMLVDEEITPVYDGPVFVLNGALIFNAKNAPFEIEHINANFQWEEDDDELLTEKGELTEEEKELANKLFEEMTLKSDNVE